jgi:orotidine-5'-phosphate decarboxylase
MTARVFCAIDANTLDDAAALVKRLAGTDVGIKLGLEFFVAEGPKGIEAIKKIAGSAEIFLDLKLHDIPNTVAGAVKAAVKCNPDFLTLHTSGGAEMMKAAVDAARGSSVRLLGVTVLTSLDEKNLASVGQGTQVEEQVQRLATLAETSGLAGVVCSPKEIGLLRKNLKAQTLLVVPGIRPAGADTGDQKRVMTPVEASSLGADYLVIGRPITQAADPALAAREILASMAKQAA